MKKLQNNYTTPEQSKRLLELVVPADSADCYYSHYIKTYAHSEYTEVLWHRPRFITDDNIPNWNARLIDGTQTYLPCWSAGRLVEIIGICHQPIPTEMRIATSNIIEYLLDIFDTITDGGGFDFSKLEE